MRDLSRKKITFLTGTRADFGKLKPLIQSIAQNSSQYSYEIIATGMHLLEKYGSTIGELHKAGFENVVPMFNQEGLATDKMDAILANTITPLSHYFNEKKPDLFIVHGDRVESLAGAISGTLNNIRVAHIEGGEISGTIDESIRHAISKLVPLHLVSNVAAKRRLLQMGEREDSIFQIGSPEVDVMLGQDLPALQAVKNHYRIEFSEYALAMYHPVTTEVGQIEEYAKNVVDAILQANENFILIEPNNDLGAPLIRKELERLKGLDRIKIFPSLRFEYYLTLLKNCKYFLGNSSSGVREAPVFGVPSINLGTRQSGRSASPGIIDSPEITEEIIIAINSVPKRAPVNRAFGTGSAALAFSRALESTEFWSVPLQKRFFERSIV